MREKVRIISVPIDLQSKPACCACRLLCLTSLQPAFATVYLHCGLRLLQQLLIRPPPRLQISIQAQLSCINDRKTALSTEMTQKMMQTTEMLDSVAEQIDIRYKQGPSPPPCGPVAAVNF